MKKQKGITLIALVITIIVLLILAGVAITTLTGDNGILTKAGNAKIISEQAEILEQLRLEMYERRADIENSLTEIEYLKQKKIIKQEITEAVEVGKYASIQNKISIAEEDATAKEIYYIIDVAKLINNPSTGMGDWENGDVYYLFNGELYYKEKNREAKTIALGKIFEIFVSTDTDIKWLYEENEDGNIEIIGVKIEKSSTEEYNYFSEINLGTKDLKIPSYIDGKKVVCVSFDHCEIEGDSNPANRYYCIRDVEKIQLPDNLERVNMPIFDIREGFFHTINLKEIIISENNEKFSTQDGVLFNKNKTSLIRCPEKKQTCQIPDTVTSIGDSAFRECDSLKSITIPDTVTNIGDEAFEFCVSLESIAIPRGVTSIGYSMLRECNSLKSITIPDTVTNIGGMAFMGCSSLESIAIPSSVTNIDSCIFGECEKLTAINFPDGKNDLLEISEFKWEAPENTKIYIKGIEQTV